MENVKVRPVIFRSTCKHVIIGTGIGIGLIGRGAMDAIGRQPDASNKILVAAIVIAALVEGIAFAALFAVN